MTCCGHRRTLPSGMPSPTAAPSPASSGPPVALRYLGAAAVMVRGPATGRHYAFSAAVPAQAVDARDAAGLLRSGLFRRS